MRVMRIHREQNANAPDRAPSDADLVAAARVDRQAFAALYERYRDDLLRYSYYCLGNWDDAADTTQQVFANAFAGLPRFIDHDNSFRPWLFRIAHNEICTRQQQRARRPQGQLDDAFEIVDRAPSPEDLAIAADDHQRLWLLLEHLSPDRRRVCELRFAGLKDREIAAILGKNEGTIRVAQSRAVAQLRELMGIDRTTTGDNDA